MRKHLLILLMWGYASLVFAGGAGHNPYVVQAPISENDNLSRQRGARLFVNYCYGCHSLQYLRYEKLSQDLRIPESVVENSLMFTGDKLGDRMEIAMQPEIAQEWFGVPPPDLTLEARLRGADWLYSYLIGFYPDENRPWGVNNHVYENVGMPHVMEDVEVSLGREKFTEAMADLTNFLVYVAEPTKQLRERIGVYVLLFLAILAIPVYLLNREYWKDIKA